MNEPTKENKPTKPITDHKQRDMSIVELLLAAATIAGIVAAALPTTKRPPGYGD